MFIALFFIFFGAIIYNIEFTDTSGKKFNLQFMLYVGIFIALIGAIYYCAKWLKDVFEDRNTRSLYAFVTNSTSITERCRFPIKKKVELHPDVEFDAAGNGDWKKALTGLKNQLKEQGINPDEKGLNLTDEALTACLKLCQIVGFNYIYYVELKRKWIWRNSSNEEGIERFLDLTFRKWGDEYPDANIHDEELFGALSDAEVGLCWLVKWGDAREWVPIYHSKMTLEDAHVEVMLATKALKKMGKLNVEKLTPEEEEALKKESHKGYKSPADENQIKEAVILGQNAYNSQLSTQDSDIRLENASLKRKLENALDKIEELRQYNEELFDTELGIAKTQPPQQGIRISGSALAGIVTLMIFMVGFIGYLLQFTGWFHAG